MFKIVVIVVSCNLVYAVIVVVTLPSEAEVRVFCGVIGYCKGIFLDHITPQVLRLMVTACCTWRPVVACFSRMGGVERVGPSYEIKLAACSLARGHPDESLEVPRHYWRGGQCRNTLRVSDTRHPAASSS